MKSGYVLRYSKSIALAIIIMTLSVVSTNEIAPKAILSIPYSDKYVHFLMYTALSFILLLDFNRQYISIYPGIVIPLIIGVSYGGLIEVIQMFLPFRSADIIDFLFDIGGAGFGFLIFLLWRKIRY